MNIRRIICAMALVLAGFLSANGVEYPDFWKTQPDKLAARYREADANFDQEWVLQFADSLDALSSLKGNAPMKYYASALRCHNAFNRRDSLSFFSNSLAAREHAIDNNLMSEYFSELLNVVSYHMNEGNMYKAQTSANYLLMEARQRSYEKGAYYGYYSLGLLHSSRGSHTKAIECYEKAIDIVVSDPENSYAVAMLRCYIATEYMEMEEYGKAIEWAELARPDSTPDDDIDAILAIANFRTGDYDAFFSHSDAYIREESNSSISYPYYVSYFNALRCALQGRQREAFSYAEEITDNWELCADISRISGDWKNAYEYSSKAYESEIAEKNEMLAEGLTQMENSLDEIASFYNIHEKILAKKYICLIVLILVIAIVALATVFTLKNRRIIRLQKKALEQAEKSEKVKIQFIQNMSHEIRTPLNAIVGFSQILGLPEGIVTNEERDTYSSYITSNSDFLMMLIDDILDIADVDSGNYRIELGSFSCNEICRNAMNTVQCRLPQNIELRFKTDLEDGTMINTDGKRVQQVLVNYLTNAFKHTSKGFVELSCSGTENPGRITFAVTDTGCGIPEEKAADIFERFVKLDSFKPGTGLGLNICRTIAEKLDAEVRLDSSYKQGARFLLIVKR